jgi:hypothetical protein
MRTLGVACLWPPFVNYRGSAFCFGGAQAVSSAAEEVACGAGYRWRQYAATPSGAAYVAAANPVLRLNWASNQAESPAVLYTVLGRFATSGAFAILGGTSAKTLDVNSGTGTLLEWKVVALWEGQEFVSGSRSVTIATVAACLRKVRPEEAGDAAGVSDADLDVIKGAESGGGIDRLAFIKEPAYGVVGNGPGILTQAVEVVHHGTVEKAGFGFRAFIARRCNVSAEAALNEVFVRKGDEIGIVGISEIKAMAEVYDGSQNRWLPHRASRQARRFPGPPQSPRGTSLPKVDATAEPVPRIDTGFERPALENHLDYGGITAVIAKDDLRRGH